MNYGSMIKKGSQNREPRIVLMGIQGVGKTWFSAQSPRPIIVCAENGLCGMKNEVETFTPDINAGIPHWCQVLGFLEYLLTSNHDRQTICVDTLDWLEFLADEYICSANNKKSMPDFGYGKGEVLVMEEWLKFFRLLDNLNVMRKMTVLITAHTKVVTAPNPEGDNYEKYEMKLSNKKLISATKEWCDAFLFAAVESSIIVDKNTKKGKALGRGNRVVYTCPSCAYDAKNRYGLPAKIPLDAATVMSEIHKGFNTDQIVKDLEELIKDLPEEKQQKAKEYIEKNRNRYDLLIVLSNRIQSQQD